MIAPISQISPNSNAQPCGHGFPVVSARGASCDVGAVESRRKDARHARLPSAESLFAALDGFLELGLAELDEDCTFLRVNGWWRQFPLPAGDLTGQCLESMLEDISGGWADRRAGWLTAGTTTPLIHTFRLRTCGPEPVWLELTCRPVLGAEGTKGFFAVVRDISRQKTEHDELCRTLERERELNNLKSGFVTMVSHEFRNPLTAIVCATEVLQAQLPAGSGEAEADTREYLGAIVRSADRMCRLMDELLLLGKIETGALRFSPLELSPVELCGALRRELESAELQQRVVIATELGDDDLADLDPALLRHTLGNLLSNALKYSPSAAPVSLGVSLEGDDVCFTVADRGIGIPEREQKRLFKAFFRASNVGATKGSGVGLNIAHQCARLHGGRLECTSSAGQGTTFTLRIPRHCAPMSRPQSSPVIIDP